MSRTCLLCNDETGDEICCAIDFRFSFFPPRSRGSFLHAGYIPCWELTEQKILGDFCFFVFGILGFFEHIHCLE